MSRRKFITLAGGAASFAAIAALGVEYRLGFKQS